MNVAARRWPRYRAFGQGQRRAPVLTPYGADQVYACLDQLERLARDLARVVSAAEGGDRVEHATEYLRTLRRRIGWLCNSRQAGYWQDLGLLSDKRPSQKRRIVHTRRG